MTADLISYNVRYDHAPYVTPALHRDDAAYLTLAAQDLIAAQLLAAAKQTSFSHRISLYQTIGIEMAKSGLPEIALEAATALSRGEMADIPPAIQARIIIQAWMAATYLSLHHHEKGHELMKRCLWETALLPKDTISEGFSELSALWQICLVYKRHSIYDPALAICKQVIQSLLRSMRGFRVQAGMLCDALPALAEMSEAEPALKLTQRAELDCCLAPPAAMRVYGRIASAGYRFAQDQVAYTAYQSALRNLSRLPLQLQSEAYAFLANALLESHSYNFIHNLAEQASRLTGFAAQEVLAVQAQALAMQGQSTKAFEMLHEFTSEQFRSDTLLRIGHALLEQNNPSAGGFFLAEAVRILAALARCCDRSVNTWAKGRLLELAACKGALMHVYASLVSVCHEGFMDPAETLRLKAEIANTLYHLGRDSQAQESLNGCRHFRTEDTTKGMQPEVQYKMIDANMRYACAVSHRDWTRAAQVLEDSLDLLTQIVPQDQISVLDHLMRLCRAGAVIGCPFVIEHISQEARRCIKAMPPDMAEYANYALSCELVLCAACLFSHAYAADREHHTQAKAMAHKFQHGACVDPHL